MRRGDLYRVAKPTSLEPKKHRIFVIVSRQALISTGYSTVVCAPVYSSYHGLASQVLVGTDEGLAHPSSIHCDDLVSLPKSVLTNFVGVLSQPKIDELNNALKVALGIPD
ncbi:MAG: type II toxin-antitoxin system PemK/MazF family toxin [Chloroflexi bacterium]|nr:type II toxin-antitoxin system PemK/MazF family toxin [Chloroflexota bacterium]